MGIGEKLIARSLVSACCSTNAEKRICSPAVPLTEATLPASVVMSYVGEEFWANAVVRPVRLRATKAARKSVLGFFIGASSWGSKLDFTLPRLFLSAQAGTGGRARFKSVPLQKPRRQDATACVQLHSCTSHCSGAACDRWWATYSWPKRPSPRPRSKAAPQRPVCARCAPVAAQGLYARFLRLARSTTSVR